LLYAVPASVVCWPRDELLVTLLSAAIC
jgi:hypothetical protein